MQPTKPNHELRDIRFSFVLLAIASLLLIVIVGLGAGYGLYQLLRVETPNGSAAAEPATIPPPPRVTDDPGRQFEALRAITQQQMTSYGWVDRAQGKVRIPVARAMEMIAAQGLPTRAQTPPRDQTTTQDQAPTQTPSQERTPE